MARLETSSQPIPQSLPPNFERNRWRGGELNTLPSTGAADYSDDHESDELEKDNDSWLLEGYSRSYGAAPTYLQERLKREQSSRLLRSHRKRGKRRHFHSTTIASITSLNQLFGEENKSHRSHHRESHSSSSSEEDSPPIVKMIYRRSPKDLLKLFLLPTLYFLFMIIAVVFAFYTIQGLVLSYSNHVQSVQVRQIEWEYDPVAIVIMPQFSSYVSCDYRYYDDLSPNETVIETCNNHSIPLDCIYTNVTFTSEVLGVQRHAMVFRGPTLVYCKQSLRLLYNINTNVREFSAVEYILFDNWNKFNSSSHAEQLKLLADMEKNKIIHTFPSGSRTWVKMKYEKTTSIDGKELVDYSLLHSYAAYTPACNSCDPIRPTAVIFEWQSPTYTSTQELISTTAFNAIGSLCGILITLIKAGEFCRQWIRRIRREKQKKMLHLQELERKQQQLMADYEARKKERREARLKAKEAIDESCKKDPIV